MIGERSQLSWTPKRKGAIYCAPACGGGCTWAAFQKAKKDAAALAKECGPGYAPRVHENLGWHFAALSPCGRIYVSRYRTGSYGALFGEPYSCSGRYVGHGKTAREAIEQAIAQAESDLASIGAMLVEVAR